MASSNEASNMWDLRCSAVFGNSLILSEIFKHVSNPNDFKRIRLVCRLWRDISLEEWRHLACLRLLWGKDDPAPYCHCSKPGHPTSTQAEEIDDDNMIRNDAIMDVSDYLQLLDDSRARGANCPNQFVRKPFSRFNIVNLPLHKDDIFERDGNLQRFLEVCGPNLKYLKLDHCVMESSQCSQILHKLLWRKLPNLVELAVVIAPVKNDDNDEDRATNDQIDNERQNDCVNFDEALDNKLVTLTLELCQEADLDCIWEAGENLVELVYMLPDLKNLTLDSRDYNALRALSKPAIKHGKPIQLRSLSFSANASLTEEHYRLLNTYLKFAKPSMEVLKMPIDSVRSDGYKQLRKVLKRCRSTLENLELHSYPKAVNGQSLSFLLRGLTFPQLTKLCLYDEPVVNFRALVGLPKLRTLSVLGGGTRPKWDWNRIIEGDSDEGDSNGEQEQMLWNGMEHLHISYFRLNANSLTALGKWMPNLKSLRLHLVSSTEQVARKIWPNLEELTFLSRLACPISQD